jgi:hypothetical protein
VEKRSMDGRKNIRKERKRASVRVRKERKRRV